MYEIFDEREWPYYEHRLPAQGAVHYLGAFSKRCCATPLPRLHRIRVGPQHALRSAGLVLYTLQRSGCDVAVEDRRHAGTHLFGAGVDPLALNRESVAIDRQH